MDKYTLEEKVKIASYANITKEAMTVIKSRAIASTPELAKRFGVGEGGVSDVVIYKPFLRGAKGKAAKEYRSLITEYFLGLGGGETKQYNNIKDFDEKKKMLFAIVKKRGWSGRTTLRARKPLIFGRKKFEKASMNPHKHITLFNKDKDDAERLMQNARLGFGRFMNPMGAYKSYNRTGWKITKGEKL